MVEKYNEKNLKLFLEEYVEYVKISSSNKKVVKAFEKTFTKEPKILSEFISKLEIVKQNLRTDLDFFMISDPAISSKDEVVITYPGFKAICYYRVAHLLYELGFVLNARIITEKAHTKTGIDIHPGAIISSPFFIDHGTGIVIGQTSIVGNNVKIYQGVTLGALSLSEGSKMRGVKRHPTIGNNVTIYAGASILGAITVGDNVTIGSNVFITENIPSNTKVVFNKPDLIMVNK